MAQSPQIDEVRIGVLAHSVEPSNAEGGLDVNVEVLLRKPTYDFGSAVLNAVLRAGVHLGASLNLAGDTSQLYAGLTWDAMLASTASLELSFGASVHDGPTDREHPDAYGCAVNFRESASLGYALDERWTVFGTVAHMSNGELCSRNTGITSAGIRLGYKLK